MNASAADANVVATDIVANIFMLGFKTKKGSLTLFANAKSNLAWEFSKDFTTVAANGFGESFSKYVIPAFFNKDNDGVLQRARMTQNGKLTERFSYLQDYVDGK